MRQGEITEYGGVCGRVLWGTISAGSLSSGLLVGLALLVGNATFIAAEADAFTTPFTQIVIALALARFVINGQYGEWEGSIISGAGGPWSTVLTVAVRYMTLTLVWLAPLLLLGLRPQAFAAPTMVDGKSFALFFLYFMFTVLSPPVLLIASVTAENFGELFSTDYWKALFNGRAADLVAIYAVYTGGMAMALVVCLPVVVLGFAAKLELGVFLLGVAVCFMLGVSLNLLGRLCGFFALGDIAAPPPAIAQPVPSEPPPTVPLRSSRPAADPLLAAIVKPAASATKKKPPLLDAVKRIQPIMDRAERDTTGAIRALEDLYDSYAPHPQVIWGLCVCRARSGDTEKAIRLAGEALPLCFDRGHTHLAADIYKELRAHVKRLDLDREKILAIAAALASKDDLGPAGEAYSSVICKDSTEMRAIKGLLQIGQTLLDRASHPEAAVKVFRFLRDRCGASPLGEFIEQGLEQAERAEEKKQVPVG